MDSAVEPAINEAVAALEAFCLHRLRSGEVAVFHVLQEFAFAGGFWGVEDGLDFHGWVKDQPASFQRLKCEVRMRQSSTLAEKV